MGGRVSAWCWLNTILRCYELLVELGRSGMGHVELSRRPAALHGVALGPRAEAGTSALCPACRSTRHLVFGARSRAAAPLWWWPCRVSGCLVQGRRT
jgi:hypothetical protein